MIQFPLPRVRRLGIQLLCTLACGAHFTALTAAPKSYGDPATPVAGTALGVAIHTRDAEELRYVVLKQLTDRYAREKGIEVSPADKDAYLAGLEESRRRDRRERQARRDDLARKLGSGTLSKVEREKIAAEIDALDKLMATLAGLEAEAARNPQETRAAREQIASAFIRQWKIHRELHRQYGGRIIYQQGGPEPLDATRRFLEESQARGDFAIRDNALETAFWRYYRNDAIHSFYKPGSPEEAKAFAAPPWQGGGAEAMRKP